MPIIEARDLTKTYRVYRKGEGLLGAFRGLVRRKYNEVQAVAGVSFTIEPGEFVGFLGPNGAKGTDDPQDARWTHLSDQRRGHGIRSHSLGARRRLSPPLLAGDGTEELQLWWDLPAADSFQLHREIYSIPKDVFDRTLGELTDLFGIAALTRQPVRELSLGERMKMELIAALLHQPQLLLLDEPTIGLDVVAQVTIQKCLREYNASRGVTVLLTSHYMRDIEALCKRVLVITHGKLVYDGPLAGIADRFGRHKQVKLQFAGEPPTGLEAFGEIAGREGPTVDLHVDRTRITEVLSTLLDRYTIVDMSVEDPPLEKMIARVFEQGKPEPSHA